MNNETKLSAKTRLYSELEAEFELSINLAKHYLSIGAYDFLLNTVQKLVNTENQISELSIEIRSIREVIEQEAKDIL